MAALLAPSLAPSLAAGQPAGQPASPPPVLPVHGNAGTVAGRAVPVAENRVAVPEPLH